MECKDCDLRMKPFDVCIKYKWNLRDKFSEVIGCNVDGRLFPLIGVEKNENET